MFLIVLLETCWVLTLRLERVVFIAGKHPKQTQQLGADISVSVRRGKKMRKRGSDCWWMCVTSSEGWSLRVCVCVCLCVSGLDGGGGSCCHFLLGSLVYVCPLAWTPVRSFLMISFTVEETKREISHSDQYVFHIKFGPMSAKKQNISDCWLNYYMIVLPEYLRGVVVRLTFQIEAALMSGNH